MLSTATIIKSLNSHDIRSAVRDDGKIYAELLSPRLNSDGDITALSEWTEVPTDADDFLEFLGY